MFRTNLGICADLTNKQQLEICNKIFEQTGQEFDVCIIHEKITDASKSLNIPMIDSSNLWSYKGIVLAFSLQKIIQLTNIPSNINPIYMIDYEPVDLGLLLVKHDSFKAISMDSSKTKEYKRLLGDNINLSSITDIPSLIQELNNG
tara:strand:- start:1121 stop:1558 length:438 start_codon:yes stop_codon:yes gene_type:complete